MRSTTFVSVIIICASFGDAAGLFAAGFAILLFIGVTLALDVMELIIKAKSKEE